MHGSQTRVRCFCPVCQRNYVEDVLPDRLTGAYCDGRLVRWCLRCVVNDTWKFESRATAWQGVGSKET